MLPDSDDEVINDFIELVKRDDEAKKEFAALLRVKDEIGLRQAAMWVVDNIIKPGVIAVRDRFIPAIADWLKEVIFN